MLIIGGGYPRTYSNPAKYAEFIIHADWEKKMH